MTKVYIYLKKQLDLRCCNIGHEEAKVIAKELSFNATLVSLNLEINLVGDIGASALAVALQKNKTLTLLNLENNGIGAFGPNIDQESIITSFRFGR
jgi:Leucine Rich repeat